LQLDWCVFSLLFSRSLVFHYADIAAVFLFFYAWFYLMSTTSAAHACADPHTTASIWESHLKETIPALA
jgi:hypothetical protein